MLQDKRNAYLVKTYGITIEDYEMLLARQDYSCLICNTVSDSLVVDHQHRPNQRATADDVRGLLCSECNKALGHFKDSPALLRTAFDLVTFFEFNGYPWNGYDACYVCGHLMAELTLYASPDSEQYRGVLCVNCLHGMQFFCHNKYNFLRAIAYLYYYDGAPRGKYWLSNYLPFPNHVPESLIEEYTLEALL